MLTKEQAKALPQILKKAAESPASNTPNPISESMARSVTSRYGKLIEDLLHTSPGNGLRSIDLGCGATDDTQYQPHVCRTLEKIQRELGCTDARTVGIDRAQLHDEIFEAHGGVDLQDKAALDQFESNAWDLITSFGFIGADHDDPATAPELSDLERSEFDGLRKRIIAEVQRLLRDDGVFLCQQRNRIDAIRKRKGSLDLAV